MRTIVEATVNPVNNRYGVNTFFHQLDTAKRLESVPWLRSFHFMKAKIHEDKIATEYLANERTFLAWIRTSIAVISLGFVIAKFSVWLNELASGNLTVFPVARR